MTKRVAELVTKISAVFEGQKPEDVLLVLASVAAALCHKFGANPAAFIEAFNVSCEATERPSNGRAKNVTPAC